MDILLCNNFEIMNSNDMYAIDGGGWSDFFYALAGGVCIAISPIVGVLAGVGAATISAAAPGLNIAIGVSSGVGACLSMIGTGSYFLDKACGGY